MKSKELYDLAAEAIAQAEAILAKADAEDNRPLTEDEESQVSEYTASAEKYRHDADLVRTVETTRGHVDSDIPHANAGDVITAPAGLPRPVVEKVRERAQDDPARGFAHIGEFAAAVAQGMTPGTQATDDRLRLLAAATGMEQATGSKGGFLVPPSFSQTIWDGLNQDAQSLIGMCDQYTVDGESLTIPANAETSRANGYRYGGIRGYWLSEASQMTGSYPKLRQVKVEPHQLAVLSYVTDKLLNNATALQQYLTRAATNEISFKVGDAIINGTGAGQPLGILSSSCLVTVAKETSQAADTIVAQNLRNMRARLHVNSWSRSVWLMNQDVWPEIDNLFTQVTNVAGSENVGGFEPQIYNRERNTLYGRPIMQIEYAGTLGDVGDIILADMQSYILGTKGGVNSAASIHLRFDYNETAFRWIFEVDGQPYLNSALTPYKGTNTLSTFVTLAARA